MKNTDGESVSSRIMFCFLLGKGNFIYVCLICLSSLDDKVSIQRLCESIVNIKIIITNVF